MKELLKTELLEGGIELFEAQKYVRQGTIFYPKTCSYEVYTYKARPVLVMSVLDNVTDGIVICCDITSNCVLPSQVPILIDGKLSFISPFREHVFASDDFTKGTYYGAVNNKILEIIKYIKLKHLYGIYSEEYEKALNEYIEKCLGKIENGNVELRRNVIPSNKIRNIYMGGAYTENTDDNPLVYRTDVDQECTTSIGSLLPDIEIKDEELHISNEEDDNGTMTNINDSIQVVEEIPKIKVNTKKSSKKIKYWYNEEGREVLKSNVEMTLEEKAKMLEDIYQADSMRQFGIKFGVTGQTVRTRIDISMRDLKKAGIEIPNVIYESLKNKGVRHRKQDKITPPPETIMVG